MQQREQIILSITNLRDAKDKLIPSLARITDPYAKKKLIEFCIACEKVIYDVCEVLDVAEGQLKSELYKTEQQKEAEQKQIEKLLKTCELAGQYSELSDKYTRQSNEHYFLLQVLKQERKNPAFTDTESELKHIAKRFKDFIDDENKRLQQ